MRLLLPRARAIFQQPGFAGLLGSAFALGMGYSFVVPFISLWGTREVGMRPVLFGVFMTVNALSAIVVSTLLGRWSDTHLRRKTLLLLGAAGGVLGYIGYAFVREPWALIAIGSTTLALASVCFSQLFAFVREEFGAADLAAHGVAPRFLMSVVRVSFSFAWTIGPALAAAAMGRFGFRGMFLGAATLYGIFLLGVLRFVPFRAPRHDPAAAARPPLRRALARGDIAAVFGAFLLFFAAHAVNMMNLPLFLTTSLGGENGQLGIVFAVGPVVEIPLMLWFGYLAARGHQLALIRLGAAASLAYFLALLLAQAPWHIYLCQILSGVAFAILTNVAILFFQDLFPGQPGLATALFSNAGNLGNLMGYFSFGALAEALGQRNVYFVCAALGAVTFATLMLYRHRPERASNLHGLGRL